MSKIARIYQGTNEIQKYYQGGVLQRLFFDWKHYIGNELNIEYAKECAGRNVVISGKTTIQGVPSDYTILDYIECTGTQYIDTGFKANTTTTKFVGAFTPTQKVTGGLLGSRNATSSGTHACNVFVLAEGKFRVDWANGTNVNHTVTETDYVVGTKYEMEITRGTVVINGTTKSSSNRTSIDQLGNFLIGNFNNVNEPYNNGFIGYIHECKLYSNDVLIRDFIPVKRISDNVVGMYDIVTDTFYTNAGANSFIAGEKVVNDEIESTGEKEDNLVTIRNYNYKCETDGVVLPNETKNSIDIIDGKKVHVQRVGNVLIDGTKTWNKKPDFSSESYMVCYFRPSEFLINAYKDNIISNYRYIIRSYPNSGKEVDAFTIEFLNGSYYNTSIYCGLKATSTDEFRNRLNENPINIYYQLEEPIYTYLESGLYDDITLPDGTKNEISYSNGKHIHTRKIDKVVFDGSDDENWYINSSNNQFVLKKSDSLPKDSYYKEIGGYFDKIIASVKTTSYSNLDNATGYGINYTYFFRLNLEEVDVTNGATVDDLRAYLKENSITCYLEFSNYIETELYYNDITYKLNEPLRSLPNGVCDTIEEGKIVRRVGKCVLDRTQTYNLINMNQTKTTRVYVILDNAKTSKGNNNLICNWFIREGDHGDYEYIVIIPYNPDKSANAVFISVLNSKLETPDLNGIKKYFTKNPLPFYYELETPIETEITPDMILINGEPITDTVGIELPNGTKDSIENGYYIKRIRKVIFDGSSDEMWKFSGVNNTYKENHNGANLIEYRLNPYIASKKENNFSYESIDNTLSPYYGTGVNYISLPENSFMCQGNFINFGCHFDTLTEFRTFLSENPFTFWYELATPVKIPLFSIKEGLTTLKSTNNITPQTELDCLVRDDFQNMCDNEWESGNIDSSTGLNSEYGTRIRLKNFIKVVPNTNYRIDITNLVEINNVGYIGIRYYDLINNYINYFQVGNLTKSTFIFTTPEDCYYIRFIAETADTNFKIYLKKVIN